MQNNSCRQLFFDLFQMLKWRTKQEQSQTCLSYALQGGIRRSQMTEQREQNPSLLEFCRIATNSTKSNGGTKGQWDKGTFVFSIFQFGQKRPIKIIIYIINIIRPFAVLPHSFLTMQNHLSQCPNVPMSQCPIVPFFLSYPLFLLNRLRGKPFNHIQVLRGTMGQRDIWKLYQYIKCKAWKWKNKLNSPSTWLWWVG